MVVLKHELTHYIANSSQYSDIAKVVLKEEFGYKDRIPTDRDIEAIKTSYANHGINIDDTDAYNELVADAVQNTDLFKDQASINKLVETNPSLSQKVFTMLNNIKNKLGNNSEYYKSLNSLTDKYINAIDSSEGNDKESYSVQRKEMISFTNKEYKKTHRKGIVLAHNELDLVDYIKNSYFKKIDGTRLGIGFISDEKARKLQFDTNYPESIINMMLCIMPNDGHTAERHITDYAKHNNPIPITVEIVSEAINIISNSKQFCG